MDRAGDLLERLRRDDLEVGEGVVRREPGVVSDEPLLWNISESGSQSARRRA